ncbi:hypothetical protein [Waltera sp.]|uniref:hypothetical protein n=1 Tax=Waltera sp. TaxID=2815806 RepID=UPI0039909F78
MRFKSIILTAKEKICFQERTECNPGSALMPRTFDRINDAIYDLLTREEFYQKQNRRVCPETSGMPF